MTPTVKHSPAEVVELEDSEALISLALVAVLPRVLNLISEIFSKDFLVEVPVVAALHADETFLLMYRFLLPMLFLVPRVTSR